MSVCDRMSSERSLPTTSPGPTVHGPPTKHRSRAPRRGAAVSNSPTATLIAAPVHRSVRWSAGVGHGSFERSSRIDSIAKAPPSPAGHTKRPIADDCGGIPPPGFIGCPPCVGPPAAYCPPAGVGEMNKSSCTFWTVYSLVPRNATDLWHSPAKPISWTWTWQPNVMRPTSASSGSRLSVCATESLSSSSSFSGRHVSRQNRNTGAPDEGRFGSSYSTVVNCGISSAGKLVSEMFSA
mmetsp:Transcript_19657/g.78233  ORF Transcript_19657/g.78233 Transcript_19657/m.78233 type:complete len:237 (-) Transcript_19657:413-1123(-)